LKVKNERNVNNHFIQELNVTSIAYNHLREKQGLVVSKYVNIRLLYPNFALFTSNSRNIVNYAAARLLTSAALQGTLNNKTCI